MAEKTKTRESYPFTSDIQSALVRQIVADPTFLPRVVAHFTPSKLSDPEAAALAGAARGYYREYEKVPTFTEVYQDLRLQVEAGVMTADELAGLKSYYEAACEQPPIDSRYAADLIFREERAAAMFRALDSGMSRFKVRTAEAFDRITEDITQANLIGRGDAGGLGVNHVASLATRTQNRKVGKVTPRYGTGIVPLDDLLSGGLAPGELGCWLAPAKGGKSQALSHCALYHAGLGGTVVYLTYEMSEDQITDRHDAAISLVPIDDLAKYADRVEQKVTRYFSKYKGSIIVKYMTPGTSVREIRAYLQQLRAEWGVQPTMLIVDYADKLNAVTRGAEKRYEEMGLVYQELRSLLNELKIPGWTASQATREALEQKVITADKIASSWAKVAEVDVLVAICRTEEERTAKQLRLFIAACRYATDGLLVGPMQSRMECGLLVLNGGVNDAPE